MTDKALSAAERASLLRLARTQIERTLQGSEPAALDAGGSTLGAGAFVSLHVAGRLRGCIGTFETSRPVQEQVREMATAAATRDPRFPPVTTAELPEVDIEISVLTPPRVVDDVSEIVVGRHGLVVTRGYRRGVLLPQVATEHGWDRQTFLEHTCVKAGLPPDSWQAPETVVEVFTAEVFGEAES